MADKIVSLSQEEQMIKLYNAENKKSIERAKKMLDDNADINFISRLTKLTIDEINNLK